MVLRIIYFIDEFGGRIAFAFLVLPELPEGVEIVFAESRDCADHSSELPV